MIAIIGAGPVGLEAALEAVKRGHEFTIVERGEVADAVRQWGHVRMFSPFAMNASAAGCERLRRAGSELPVPEALLTGAEFREAYLQPLAQSFAAHVQEHTTVLAVGRARHWKGDSIGATERGAAPFRLLLRDEKKGERVEEADLVLDCSGTYGQSNSLGEGGIPVPGETNCAEKIHYGVPDLAESTDGRFLVVGAGHSAATVVRDLARGSGTVTWLIRRPRELPAEEVPNDPLPERAHLAAAANELVRSGRVQLLSSAVISSLEPAGTGVKVHWRNPGESGVLEVDEIVAATGFRPDLALTRELQLQTCWATEGTYPLAASLLGEAGADCLATPVFGAETLLHPEPGFFTLGMKSYGRAPNFLLRTGYEQVASVFDWLEQQSVATLLK